MQADKKNSSEALNNRSRVGPRLRPPLDPADAKVHVKVRGCGTESCYHGS